MKEILILSVLLNITFLILSVYVINKKGGVRYLKTKFDSEIEPEVQEKPLWYYRNSQHWEVTKSLYDVLPNDPDDIIFLGNSITFGCEWAELFHNPRIKNRGINGDNTEGILERLTQITETKPDKIFIETGTNDLALNMGINEICANYNTIIDRIKLSTPGTKVYIHSVLPTYNQTDRKNDSIIALNKKLQNMAHEKSVKYLNLFDGFTDSDGNLNMNLSYDGLHLNGQGYLVCKRLIEKYLND